MIAARRWVPFLFLALMLLGSLTVQARSDAGVVGDGTPASCTEVALNEALSGGGSITFNCGPLPFAMTLSGEKTISLETQIDGGGLITLKGQGTRHFYVNEGVKLTLLNMTLSDGYANHDGGSIHNRGTVVIDHVTLQNNATSTSFSGGAVVNYGSLTITHSLLQGNIGGGGGAVYPRWEGSTTFISNSVLRDNHAVSATAGWGGALLTWDGAKVVVENSQFTGNTALAGGAIYNTTNSDITLKDVELSGNQASTVGGAIYNAEDLRIENATITNNTGVTQGGGLFNEGGAVDIQSSRFAGNTVTDADGMGGNIANWYLFLGESNFRYGTLALTDSTVAEGIAPFAGGGLFTYGSLAIASSALISNTTAGNGGALYIATADHDGVEIQNSTIAGNHAGNHGGGLYKESGALTSGFNTIAGNTSLQEGSNIYMDAGQQGGTALYGTLLAYGDCVQNGVTSQGDNLDSGGSCGLNPAVDQLNTDPVLGPLADNGGPTLTRLPSPIGPAVDAVTSNPCPALDQRGVARPFGAACDVGAVEAGADAAPTCGGVFPVVADTFVTLDAPGASQGDAAQVEVGKDGGERRTLLAFDLGSQLPPNVVVESARLDLPLAAAAPAGATFELFAVSSPWDEAVTWDTQPAAGASYGAFNAGGFDDLFHVDLTTLAIQWSNQTIAETSVLLAPVGESPKLAFKSRESGAGATLTIVCGPAPDPLPTDTQADTLEQIQEIAELRMASAEPVLLDIRKGVVHFAEFEIQAEPQAGAAAGGDENLAQAEWFIQEYQDFLRLGADDELQLVRRSQDGLSLYFRQLHKGIPVFPSSIVIRLDGAGHVTGVTGGYTLDITLDPTPILTAAQAEEIAQTLAPEGFSVIGDTQLRYLNLTVLGEHDTETHLAWAVRLGGSATSQVAYVDAHTGTQRFVEFWDPDVFDLDLRSAQNTNRGATNCWSNSAVTTDIAWFTEAGPVPNPVPAIDADGTNAFNNIRTIYNYYMNTPGVGRDSYNGAGARIDMIIDIQAQAGNAQFTPGCNEIEFGDQMTTLDIVAHEFSHAVDESSSGLIYANQSGALDESMADIFGYLVNIGSPTARLIGVGTPGANAPVAGRTGCLPNAAFRDMADPTCYTYNGSPYPDRMSALLTLPAGTAANCTTNDCGFVHGNSSIHNKAAWLLINGGEFGGRKITGIGAGDGARLFYGMMSSCLGDTTDFLGASWCAISESQEFLSAFRQCQVKNAYAAVGINPIVGDADCDGRGDLSETDSDGDGTPNASDNCPNLINDQANIDGDALGDACDEDKDGDGLNDPLDNCPFAANNLWPDLQNDWNGNGIGDACDDSDGDRVPDGRDNCRDIPNPRQENADGDRQGDACDTNDDDDLWPDNQDNCPVVPNNGQENDDGDPFGDACDLCRGFNSPDNGDVDGDGVGNPCDPDADADGICTSGGPRTNERGLESSPNRSCQPGKGPGPSDNCPLVPNDSQLDIDNNGIGFACDADERGVFFGQVKDYNHRFSISQGPGPRIPIPVCPQCAGPYLPSSILNQVSVNLPQTVDARIVDSTGKVVAKGSLADVSRTFSFNPAPFAGRSFRLAAAAGDMAVAEVPNEPLAADVYYYLELQLLPEAAPIEDLEIEVTVEAKEEPVSPPGLLLPYVVR